MKDLELIEHNFDTEFVTIHEFVGYEPSSTQV